ncbi:MAG: FHA domain-containing protein [Nostoc sp. ChiSLP01]|nr:FHA domain-containing protein [Nostoc sp. CmiSLP01]MDZ8285170.1 FHA domain-containing protein [Nostoc sp. ChiSLP01]
MNYQLLIYLDDACPPITYDLNRANYVLGKHSDCDIFILEKFVSRHHCTLVLMPPDKKTSVPYYLLVDGLLMVQESKSTNGTWVNGNRIKAAKLNHQDIITFGPHQYPKAVFISEITEIKEDGTNSYYTESE